MFTHGWETQKSFVTAVQVWDRQQVYWDVSAPGEVGETWFEKTSETAVFRWTAYRQEFWSEWETRSEFKFQLSTSLSSKKSTSGSQLYETKVFAQYAGTSRRPPAKSAIVTIRNRRKSASGTFAKGSAQEAKPIWSIQDQELLDEQFSQRGNPESRKSATATRNCKVEESAKPGVWEGQGRLLYARCLWRWWAEPNRYSR